MISMPHKDDFALYNTSFVIFVKFRKLLAMLLLYRIEQDVHMLFLSISVWYQQWNNVMDHILCSYICGWQLHLTDSSTHIAIILILCHTLPTFCTTTNPQGLSAHPPLSLSAQCHLSFDSQALCIPAQIICNTCVCDCISIAASRCHLKPHDFQTHDWGF